MRRFDRACARTHAAGAFGTGARALVAMLAIVATGCDKVAGLLAPDPSDFLAALIGGVAERGGAPARSPWPPMSASDALATGTLARPATARCTGLIDDALLTCVVNLARVDARAAPVFDSCVGRAGGLADSMACAEYALGWDAHPAALDRCRTLRDADWSACVASASRRRDDTPLQARYLSALEVFRRESDAFRYPGRLRGGAFVAGQRSGATNAVAAAGLTNTPASHVEEPLSRQEFEARCGMAFETEEAVACRALGKPNTDAEKFLHDGHAPLREAFTPTAGAFVACTRKDGGRFLAGEALTCLRLSAAREASPEEYATCGGAFREGHPGYLTFVRACAARAGFRTFVAEDALAFAALLDTATARAGASPASLRFAYETFAGFVRREQFPADDAF